MIKKIMGIYSRAVEWVKSVFRHDILSYSNAENGNEAWKVRMSRIGFVSTFAAILFFLFLLLLILCAYTPILNILPGYRIHAQRSRSRLIESIIRVDSLERKMNDMLAYNENVILVVEGKTPALRTPQKDSVLMDKTVVPPSHADSLLRQQMEGNTQYRIAESASRNSALKNTISAVAPVNGIISEHFNQALDFYGIRIAVPPSDQVMAIADGTVIGCDWVPDRKYCVTIQHNNGVVSVSRQIANVLVHQGSRVRGHEVIGYIEDTDKKQNVSLFEFELWSDGKPIDPEVYIIF